MLYKSEKNPYIPKENKKGSLGDSEAIEYKKGKEKRENPFFNPFIRLVPDTEQTQEKSYRESGMHSQERY